MYDKAIQSEAITIQLTVGMLFDFQSCNFRIGQHKSQSLLAYISGSQS